MIRPRADDPKRLPANVALVVDTSGSMAGKPLEDARTAAHAKALLEATAELLENLATRLKNPRLSEEAKGLRALIGDLPPATAPAPRAPSAAVLPSEAAAAPPIAGPRSAEQTRRALRQYDDAVQRLQ